MYPSAQFYKYIAYLILRCKV